MIHAHTTDNPDNPNNFNKPNISRNPNPNYKLIKLITPIIRIALITVVILMSRSSDIDKRQSSPPQLLL